MKYEIRPKEKETKLIAACKNGEAFRYNDSWYVKLDFCDTGIGGFDDFFELHCIHDGPRSQNYNDFITVMHIGSQTLCYIYKNVEPDEWADITVALTLK